jgi:hypothetical protein
MRKNLAVMAADHRRDHVHRRAPPATPTVAPPRAGRRGTRVTPLRRTVYPAYLFFGFPLSADFKKPM